MAPLYPGCTARPHGEADIGGRRRARSRGRTARGDAAITADLPPGSGGPGAPVSKFTTGAYTFKKLKTKKSTFAFKIAVKHLSVPISLRFKSFSVVTGYHFGERPIREQQEPKKVLEISLSYTYARTLYNSS